MRKAFKPNHWRKRYNYVCKKCGKKRTTLDFERMKRAKCAVCQPIQVSENQQSLFKK